MNCSVRIERIANGYEVCVTDPKIVKENAKPNSRYRDATKEYAFQNIKQVLDFLQKNLDKALPDDEYSSSFDEAAKVAAEEG